MSFLFPAFLIGGCAIAVPIVLHLLRREHLPRVPFSDIRFLQAARVEQARRRRLRELLLLALRVAALLLLAQETLTRLGMGNRAGCQQETCHQQPTRKVKRRSHGRY